LVGSVERRLLAASAKAHDHARDECEMERNKSRRRADDTSSRANVPAARWHRHCLGSLLLPFAGGFASRVSWRVFVRPVIADDGLHRAYGERGAFLAADGERDGAQDHGILPGTETASIRFRGPRQSALTPSRTSLLMSLIFAVSVPLLAEAVVKTRRAAFGLSSTITLFERIEYRAI
jgi:hypothetical protein